MSNSNIDYVRFGVRVTKKLQVTLTIDKKFFQDMVMANIDSTVCSEDDTFFGTIKTVNGSKILDISSVYERNDE